MAHLREPSGTDTVTQTPISGLNHMDLPRLRDATSDSCSFSGVVPLSLTTMSAEVAEDAARDVLVVAARERTGARRDFTRADTHKVKHA